MFSKQEKTVFQLSDNYTVNVIENTYQNEKSINLPLFPEEQSIDYDYIKISYIYLDFVGSNYFLYILIDICINDTHFYINRDFDDIDGIIDDNIQYFETTEYFELQKTAKLIKKSYDEAFDYIQIEEDQYFISQSDEYNETLRSFDCYDNFDDFSYDLNSDLLDFKNQFLQLYGFVSKKDIFFLLNAEKENVNSKIWDSFNKNFFDDSIITQISQLPYLDIESHKSIIRSLHSHPIFQKNNNYIINEKNIQELLRYIDLSEYDLVPYFKHSTHLEKFVFSTNNNELIHYFFEEYVKPSNLHKYEKYFHHAYNFFKNYTIEDFKTFLSSNLKDSLRYFVLHNKDAIAEFLKDNKELVSNIIKSDYNQFHSILSFVFYYKDMDSLLNEDSLLYYYHYVFFVLKSDYMINPLFIPDSVLQTMNSLEKKLFSSKNFFNILLYKNIITQEEYSEYFSYDYNYKNFLSDMIRKEEEYIKKQIEEF